jgi:hypothetical protein
LAIAQDKRLEGNALETIRALVDDAPNQTIGRWQF